MRSLFQRCNRLEIHLLSQVGPYNAVQPYLWYQWFGKEEKNKLVLIYFEYGHAVLKKWDSDIN